MQPRNLLTFTCEEASQFLNSFDSVVTDCDGVLWRPISGQIQGVKEVIQRLQELGKNICFVSNNSAKSFESYQNQFEGIGINLNESNIIHPSIAAIQYLKSINFKKKVFCIGTPHLVNALTEAGIRCVVAPNECIENVNWVIEHCKDDEDIGAVFVDFDINFNYIKVCKAVSILRRPDVLYLVGASDTKLPLSPKNLFLGPGLFQRIINEQSGRNPIALSKPSEYLKTITMERFDITDPKRAIFIGDMLDQDMAFGSICGFQKLLVLTGGTSLNELENMKDQNLLPNYWIESFGHLSKIMDMTNKGNFIKNNCSQI